MMPKNKSTFILKRQRGIFAIELAFILFGLCVIYLYSTDLSQKLLVRGKLDRTSFSLVNILKERSRYFDGNITVGDNLNVTQQELQQLANIASRMLNTPSDEVAIKIESITEGATVSTYSSARFDALNCSAGSITDLNLQEMIPVSNGITYPLYRVSVCEQHDSWFDPFVKGGDTRYTLVSSSVIPGR